MIIGYSRISNEHQTFEVQRKALQGMACDKIYEEIATSENIKRPKLEELLKKLKKGDTLIVWKIDRIAQTITELLKLVNSLVEKEIDFISLNDPIDTTKSKGQLIVNIFSSLLEFEKNINIEKTKRGLLAARARGRAGGRPKGLSKEAKKTAMAAQQLYEEGQLTIKQICEELNIARSTLYNYLKNRGVSISTYNRKNK